MQYDLAVIGEPADWTDISPDSVTLYPEDSGAFRLTFSLPWDFSLRTDGVSFGLQASSEDGQKSSAFGRLVRPAIDVFISYARDDAHRAATLADMLARRDLVVWWDRSLIPGSQYESAIEAALEQARCVVVIWSNSAVQSDWVRAEANEGAERGVLVPLRVDDARLPLRFRQLHVHDLRDWPGVISWPGLDEFVSSIRDRLPGQQQIARAPDGDINRSVGG